MTKYKIECDRANITPKAFWAYCKKQCEKHGASIDDWADFGSWTDENACTPYTKSNHDDWDEPQTEIYKVMPYDVQMFLEGSYNFIMEFDFDDEKRGHGYFFLVEFDR